MAGCVALAGCMGPGRSKAAIDCPGVQSFNQYAYGDAVAYFRANRVMPHVDYALESLRLGSAAIAAGQYAEAKQAFRDAVGILDSFHTNTDLQKWAALVGQETVKVFKGEPYERAMAHYYLGLLYYAEADYGNASACFRNALFKLKVYDEQNDLQTDDAAESELGIAWYLLARCRQRMNDVENSKRCFQYASEASGAAAHWVSEFALNAKSNVVLIIETGKGPYKTPYGPNAVLADLNPIFASRAVIPDVWIDGHQAPAPAQLVNLRRIAAKRKWQTLDTIRYVKGFLSSGIAVQQLQATGALERSILNVVGTALGAGVSYDIRHWELMPESIFVLPLALAPGSHTLKIIYRDTRDSELPWHTQEYGQVDVTAAKERLLWVRCGPKIEGGRL